MRARIFFGPFLCHRLGRGRGNTSSGRAGVLLTINSRYTQGQRLSRGTKSSTSGYNYWRGGGRKTSNFFGSYNITLGCPGRPCGFGVDLELWVAPVRFRGSGGTDEILLGDTQGGGSDLPRRWKRPPKIDRKIAACGWFGLVGIRLYFASAQGPAFTFYPNSKSLLFRSYSIDSHFYTVARVRAACTSNLETQDTRQSGSRLWREMIYRRPIRDVVEERHGR